MFHAMGKCYNNTAKWDFFSVRGMYYACGFFTLAMMGRRMEDFTTDGAQRMNVEKDLVRVVGVF